jgi:hypothetical protein
MSVTVNERQDEQDVIPVAMLLDGKDAGYIPKPGVTKFG